MRAAIAALAAFKIAVGGAGTALVRRQDIGVHPDAHAAAGVAPFESSLGKDFVEALFFRGGFDPAGAWDDKGLLDVLRDVLAGDELGGGAQIIESGIGAR